MKKIMFFLILGYLNNSICNCQLFDIPSLTIQDFELALTNPNNLRKTLSEHNFVYSATRLSNLNELGSISNTLYPDLRILKSESWELKNPLNQSIDIVIYLLEWESSHAPHQNIIKSILILVKKDSKYPDQMRDFLEKIKIKYPNTSKRYFKNNELFKQFGEPLIVFTNESNIEVRTELPDARYINFYTISFDLVK
jgi:hypothetical protein